MYLDKLTSKARLVGFSEYEIYYLDDHYLEISSYKEKLEQNSLNSSFKLCFRGKYNGKMGCCYTEVLDNESIDFLINRTIENCKALEQNDTYIIYDYSKEQSESDNLNKNIGNFEGFSSTQINRKIDLLLRIERELYKSCNLILSVDKCAIYANKEYKKIVNSKGVNLDYIKDITYVMLKMTLEENDKRSSTTAFKFVKDDEQIDSIVFIKDALNEAASYINSECIVSGTYTALIRNTAAADLISEFWQLFNAENVQNNLSLLKGCINTQVASKCVTLIDDPMYEESILNIPFDDEGVKTYSKEIISKGILKGFFHNLKTALKDGVKSTANASRNDFLSPVGVSPTNLYIKPREKDLQEMIKLLEDGILITKLEGIQAGINLASGDFSLPAKGFNIVKGKIERPIDEIIVSGNFYKLMNNISEVGADLRFSFPYGSGYFGSPTLLVKDVIVTGK